MKVYHYHHGLYLLWTLSPEAHADVQCIIQQHIDSSISKTVNAPKGYSVEQVEKVYERLHKGGAKGGTVYVDGSRDSQVLSLTNEENKVEETDVLLEVKKEETVVEEVSFRKPEVRGILARCAESGLSLILEDVILVITVVLS
jgi:ribonucleotide reductase alpha subunit